MKNRLTMIVAVAAAALVGLAGSPANSDGSVRGAVIVTGEIKNREERDSMKIAVKTLKDKHGNVIGWGNTVCFDLGVSSTQCVGTFVFPRGKIMVAGTRHSQQYFVFAIVGGTGVYTAAGGTLIGNLISESPRTERLVFELV